MGTYYIKPNGLNQGDLVNILKDLETAFGGTNVVETITIPTTVDATKWYDTNATVSAAISAGSTFTSAMSTQVLAGTVEIQIPSLVMSYALSAIDSEGGAAGASTGESAGTYYGGSAGASAAASDATSAATSHIARSLPASAVTSHIAQSIPASAVTSYIAQSIPASVVTSHLVTPGAAGASVISAGAVLNSGISAIVAAGMTGGFASFLSHLSSKLASASIT